MSGYYGNFEGYGLGPHQREQRRKLDFYEPVKAAVAKAISSRHFVSNGILAVAGASFLVNIFLFSFGIYNSFSGSNAKLSFNTGRSGQHLGSDDNSVVGPIEYQVDEANSPQKISSQAYIVADAETGEIIFEKDSKNQYPIASLTKMMTALVTSDNVDLHHLAVVSESSHGTYGIEGGLAEGEKILTGDLIYPLLLESSNDAAEVLASDFGRESFIDLMNKKASSIGMENTKFEDPSGLSANNVSTAYDMYKLGLYTKLNYPNLLDVTRVKEYAIIGHSWQNKNAFLTYPNFVGGKNGFTNEAKQGTVSFFKVFFRGNEEDSQAVERTIMIVLLRSGDRDSDAANLLTHITKNVKYALK